ncbi:MAG: YebC/PmpR family DNA-binding transcriptional regulator [Chloroflexota bacterium]
MSGHSKWSTIKRKKGANDAVRGRLFTKLAREIQLAARGGPDATTNFALRLAVEKARSENMPKDNIERAIRRGAGLDKDNANEIEEITYEGYGPHGIAILVECLTDNRNRTISEVRRCFTRANGSMGEPGSVAWQFSSRGYIVFNLVDDEGIDLGLDPEEIFMAALEAGAEDVIISDDAVEIYTERADFASVSQSLTEGSYTPNSSSLVMKPNSTMELAADDATSVMNLAEALEELDDVTNVYHNLEITDDLIAQLA